MGNRSSRRLMFALELQRRSDAAGWNLISNAAHPGFARTNLFASGPGGLLSLATDFAAPLFGHSAADGARPILFAATSPEAKPGAYYGPGGFGELRGAPAPALIMPQARDAAAAARLWDVSEKTDGYIVRVTVGRCNWQKTSSTSNFRRTIWSRCCGSGSRMPLFASITCCRSQRGEMPWPHQPNRAAKTAASKPS